MTARKPCRWDLLTDLAALLNGGDSTEFTRCATKAAHTVVMQRGQPGLSIAVDAELCDRHVRDAERLIGYQRSIKLRAPVST